MKEHTRRFKRTLKEEEEEEEEEKEEEEEEEEVQKREDKDKTRQVEKSSRRSPVMPVTDGSKTRVPRLSPTTIAVL